MIILIKGETIPGGEECAYGASKGVAPPWLHSALEQGRFIGAHLMHTSSKLFRIDPVQNVFLDGDF